MIRKEQERVIAPPKSPTCSRRSGTKGSKGIHRKDDDYDRALSDLGLSSLHRVDASLRVFQMAADFLSWLETVLAPSPPSDSN
jgi:hypothetical protein